MKKTVLVLSLVLFLCLFSGVVKANEYTEGWRFYPLWWYLFSEPYDPKIACADDNSHCVALVYDNSIFGRGVHILYSTDFFQNPYAIQDLGTISADFSSFVRGWYDNYHLPYDITYIDGDYYFFVTSRGYRLNMTTLSISQIWTLSHGTYPFCGGEGWGIQKINQTHFLIPVINNCGSWTHVNMYLVRFTDMQLTDLSYRVWSCGSPPTSFSKLKGFATKSNTGSIKWEWKAEFGGSSSCSDSTISTPFPYNGLNYYHLNNLLVQEPYNASLGIVDGLYTSYTTDLSGFGTLTLRYAFNKSINEWVNATSVTSTSNSNVYVFERYTNSSTLPSGIYIYRELMHPIYVVSKYVNPITKESTLVPSTISMICNDGSFSTTQTATTTTFYVPCNNLTVNIQNSNYLPHTYTYNLYIPDECSDYMTLNLRFYKEYNFTVYVYSSETGQPLQNAMVRLNSNTYYTDSNGSVTIELNPLINPEFSVEVGATNCTRVFNYKGTPMTYDFEVSKDDYETYTEELQLAVNEGTEDEPRYVFTTDKSVFLQLSGARLTVKVRSKDGKELKPHTDIVSVSGANKIYLLSGESLYNQSSTQGIPATFVLIDNRTSYTVNVTLIHTNITYQQTVNIINTTKYYTVWFTLNESVLNTLCVDNLDCLGGFCSGNIYHKLIGCIEGVCEYKSELCVLCDDDIGCYDFEGYESCESDFDCKKECVSKTKAKYGYCGSDGICKYKYVICSTPSGCINTTIGNETLGICAEHETCFNKEYGGQTRHRFLIQKYYLPEGWFQEAQYKTYLDVDYYCTPEKASSTKRECIHGIAVPKAEIGTQTANNFLTTIPDNWEYHEDNIYYYFHDISIQCDLNCDVNVEYCEYGCNDETGFCHKNPMSGGGQMKNVLDSWVNLFNQLAPDPYSKAFIWIISLFVVIVSVAYTIKSWELGAVSGIAWAVLGVIVGWLPIWVGIVFIVLTAILIAKLFSHHLG